MVPRSHPAWIRCIKNTCGSPPTCISKQCLGSGQCDSFHNTSIVTLTGITQSCPSFLFTSIHFYVKTPPLKTVSAAFFFKQFAHSRHIKRSKSYFVQLHSLSKSLTRCTVWVCQKKKENCTISEGVYILTHINSTLKIYVKLKSQHREPTSTSPIDFNFIPPVCEVGIGPPKRF